MMYPFSWLVSLFKRPFAKRPFRDYHHLWITPHLIIIGTIGWCRHQQSTIAKTATGSCGVGGYPKRSQWINFPNHQKMVISNGKASNFWGHNLVIPCAKVASPHLHGNLGGINDEELGLACWPLGCLKLGLLCGCPVTISPLTPSAGSQK